MTLKTLAEIAETFRRADTDHGPREVPRQEFLRTLRAGGVDDQRGVTLWCACRRVNRAPSDRPRPEGSLCSPLPSLRAPPFPPSALSPARQTTGTYASGTLTLKGFRDWAIRLLQLDAAGVGSHAMRTMPAALAPLSHYRAPHIGAHPPPRRSNPSLRRRPLSMIVSIGPTSPTRRDSRSAYPLSGWNYDERNHCYWYCARPLALPPHAAPRP